MEKQEDTLCTSNRNWNVDFVFFPLEDIGRTGLSYAQVKSRYKVTSMSIAIFGEK